MKVLICLAILLSGCHRNHRIAPEELRKLDGFRQGDEVKLIDLFGRGIVFTADTPLLIVVPGRNIFQEFAEINVVDNIFKGITDWGEHITVNIDEVTAAVVPILSGRRIFGWTMAGVGVASVFVFFLLLVAGVVTTP